jgi:4-hydroxybenzoate polyprenyltransferase
VSYPRPVDLAFIARRLDAYERLIRLDKPIGSLLLLWPTLWAVWLAADGRPPAGIVVIFVLGTLLMRSAGCAVNDYADRNFDPHVERTRSRPLAAREIEPWEALAVGAALAAAAFGLVLFLNRLAIALSFLGLAIAATYPYAKRVFALPQAYLGIAFGFGIPMAFAAVQDHVPMLAWVMLLANVFWSVAYDTEYAMVDRDDDIKIGIRTSALTFGRFDVAAIMLCYAVTLGIYVGIGMMLGFGVLYWLGWAAAAGCAIYHYTLIRNRERMACFAAFRHNNWLGGALFVGIAAHYAAASL